MSHPLISIITPSFNRAQFLHEAIQSVMDQNYSEVEHIIVDAASTDGTLESLSKYHHLRVVSEPDNGMYDAINKGIRMAQGEIIGLLNTDDLYASGCFEAVSDEFGRNPDALAVVGGIATFEDKGGVREFINHFSAIGSDELWYRIIQGHPVTNAWFFRRRLFDQAGYFDTNFRYAADRYFLIKIALDDGVRPVPIGQELYYYRQHSDSVTITTLDSRSSEYGHLRMKFLREDIMGLEMFLDRPSLPGEVLNRMRREHGERCYRLAATALYHQYWKQVFFATQHGFHFNFFWPFIFVEMAVRRLRKEITGHD
jgi:glycosyltransferase involved in cell wall biosynthesis